MKKKVVSTLTAAAIVSGACAAGASASTYTVQKGDSLSVIATNYHTSILDLKKVNNLSTDLIRISQILQLPEAGITAPSTAQTQVTAPATAAYYTIVRGDTLSGIARRNGISLADLRQWNNLTGDLIFPGQQVRVANGTSSQPDNAQPQPQAAVATAATASDYQIQSGDTLSKIAKMFGTTVSSLQQLNSLSSDRIYAGNTLKVSGTVQAAPVATPVAARLLWQLTTIQLLLPIPFNAVIHLAALPGSLARRSAV